VGVPMVLEVFGYHFARRSTIGRNRIQLLLLAGRKVIENDLLAIGRPARQHDIGERRVAELESLAAVQFAYPECSLRVADIGHPLPIFREADAIRRNSGKKWNELCGLRIIASQL